MIAAAIGAGLSIANTVKSITDASKEAKKEKELIEKREQENKNMFDYNYNSNYLNNTANKHAITNLKEGLKSAGKSIAGNNAVTGGTQNANNLAKEKMRDAVAQTTSQIASKASEVRDRALTNYRKNQQYYDTLNMSQMDADKKSASDSAASGLTNALQSTSSLLEQLKAKKTANAIAKTDTKTV